MLSFHTTVVAGALYNSLLYFNVFHLITQMKFIDRFQSLLPFYTVLCFKFSSFRHVFQHTAILERGGGYIMTLLAI